MFSENSDGFRPQRNIHQAIQKSFVSTYRKGEKGKFQLVVEEKRWKTLKAKLKEITRKTKPMSFDQRMQKLKEVHRG